MEVLGPALRPALGSAWDSAVAALHPVTLAMLTPAPDGTLSIAPAKSASAPVFARASTAYVQDWEGVHRLAAAGQARFKGARRVGNLLLNAGLAGTLGVNTPTSFTRPIATGAWALVASGSNDGTLADHQSGTAVRPYLAQSVTVEVGRSYRVSCLVEACTVVQENSIFAFTGITVTGNAPVLPAVSATPKRYTSPVITVTTGTSMSLRIGLGAAAVNTGDLVISHCMVEDVTGGADQNPDEFLLTTTAPVIKYCWRTNGNTVTANVVTEAPGLPLRPLHGVLLTDAGVLTVPAFSEPDSVTVFDHYRGWVASHAYTVGQRIIPSTGSGQAGGAYTGGGNGYWYECTVAGTAGASAPTWPTTGFGVTTVTDNTVTWRLGGYYRLAGYRTEGARTNVVTHCRDWTAADVVSNGTTTVAQDAIGIDGVPNTATTLSDTDATVIASRRRVVTVPADANTHLLSWYIKKDADNTRMVGLRARLAGGTVVDGGIFTLNTSTGVLADAPSAGTRVINDSPGYWRVETPITNNSTNPSLELYVYPAYRLVGGSGGDAAVTGAVVVDVPQIELNVPAASLFASSPIITAASPITRSADTLDLAKVDHFDPDSGVCLLDFEPVSFANQDSARVLSMDSAGADGLCHIRPTSDSGVRAHNGTQAIDGPAGTPGGAVRAGVRWGGAGLTQQVCVHGAAGAQVTGSERFDVTSTLRIGHGSSLPFFGAIANLRMHRLDTGTARLKTLSRYDHDFVAAP